MVIQFNSRSPSQEESFPISFVTEALVNEVAALFIRANPKEINKLILFGCVDPYIRTYILSTAYTVQCLQGLMPSQFGKEVLNRKPSQTL